ncbi:MAG TPA: radical SAM protein, partial [Candidatus Hydrogenedentes bacterium]|nr:radical SAM protein [Candidatus Hydrogenedentota bacterium]
ILEEEQADIVGVGDMICYYKEGMRVVELAKQANPNCVTIAGGTFFSHTVEFVLGNFPELDYIVRYEGEETLRDLIETLRAGNDPADVKGIAYRDGDRVCVTPPRPLIENLDDLPIPAYDLIPVDKYSPRGVMFRNSMTIQASRGCPFGCEFCTWSYTEGERTLGPDGQVVFTPRIRRKSPQRMIEEIAVLYEKYGVRHLVWVDGTFNSDTQWQDEFSSEILRRKYKLTSWGFYRADLMLDQEEAGVLEKMVQAFVTHCFFGAERGEQTDLDILGKKGISPDTLTRCCHMLERKYPHVVRQTTVLIGIPDETPKKLKNLSRYVRDLHVDFLGVHGIMPYPGTPAYNKYKDIVEEWDYSKWDMFFPVMPAKDMSRAQIAHWSHEISLDFIRKQPLRYLRGMFSRYRLRRRLHWWIAGTVAWLIARDFVASIMGKKQFEGFAGVQNLRRPEWYNS